MRENDEEKTVLNENNESNFFLNASPNLSPNLYYCSSKLQICLFTS